METGSLGVSRFSIILVSLVLGVPILGGICWQMMDNWVQLTHGRNWPTVSAVVDIVSVAVMNENDLHFKAYSNINYFLATLTYTYNNPEQQMGDYSRRFGDEDEARAWANSYRGCTITVHVDPNDPARSVLRKEDL
jgi:hypothetical protein